MKDRLGGLGMTPVIGAGLNMWGSMESALRSARAIDAQVIRLSLSPVLCGAQGEQGARWAELNLAIRTALAKWGAAHDG